MGPMLRAPLSILSPLLLLAGSLAAQDPGQEPARPQQDREIVVTASAFQDERLEVPWSAAVVGREDLRQAFRTLPEALARQASVMVQKTAYGQSSPYLRGFTGFRNLLLVDGIRLNHSAFRDGPNQYWSTVDPLTVERLELVRGPSSVLYGSDAIGGTVNAVTRAAPRGEAGSGFQAQGGVYSRYASAEDSWVGRLELGLAQGERWGLLAGYSGKDFNDLEGGADTGRMAATAYEERDGDFRFDYGLDNGVDLTFAAQTVRQIDVPRTHKTVDAVSYHGTTPGSELRREHDQVRDLVYGRASWDDGDGLWARGQLTLSYQRHAEERDRLRTGQRRDLSGFEVRDLGFLARFESESSVGTWSWGIEAHREEVDSFRDNYTAGVLTSSGVQGPVADDASYSSLAAYVQDEITGGSWSLIPGLRFTRSSLDAGRVEDPVTGNPFSVEDDYDALVGSLRGIWWLGDTSNLFAGLSQGFRAPNLSDVTAFEDTSVAELPTLGLEPERYLQLEVGAQGEESGWRWQASGYRTWIQDMIVRSPTGTTNGSGTPVVRKDNLGDGWIHGVELELRRVWNDHWSSGVVLSWMDGEVDQLEEPAAVVVRRPVTRLMPLQAVLDTRYQPMPGGWWLEGWVWAVGQQDQLSLRDETDTSRIPPGGSPGYTVFGLSAGVPLEEDVRLGLSLENLGDKDYRVHGSGINGPGRNLIVTLELRF